MYRMLDAPIRIFYPSFPYPYDCSIYINITYYIITYIEYTMHYKAGFS